MEKKLRGDANEFVDWVILVGGYASDALAAVRADPLSEAVLDEHGAPRAGCAASTGSCTA